MPGTIWEKQPKHVLERKPHIDYERFVNNAKKNFIEEFRYNFPAHITPKNKKVKWLIREDKLRLLKNIFIHAVEEAIKVEDLKILSEESEKKVEDIEKRIKEIKDDIEYISNEVSKKVEEELCDEGANFDKVKSAFGFR